MPTIQSRLPPLATFIILILSLFLFSILFGCKKTEVKDLPSETASSPANSTTVNGCETTICEDCSFQEIIEDDTTTYATVLGGPFANPYSIPNMTLAYNNVHGTNLQSVGTTHYYVRFKPQSETQLNVLDSLNLELYDYPLDRIVVQEGDYWPEAYTNLSQNEYPWVYTVVESSFQFPVGIVYQNLASLNIPNDDPVLEEEAYNLTGNNDCGNGTTVSATTPPNSRKPTPYKYEECDPGYHWDPVLRRCVPDNPPPPPPPTYLYPKGMITFKTYDDYGVIPYSAPLRYTRIVARRYYKIDKTFTDANGNFQLSKSFPKKVTIVVKFRTSSVSVKKWPIVWPFYGLSPMKKNIGTYRGNDLRNLNYEFQKGSTSKKRKTRNWLACVALNTTIETQSFLSSNSLIPLPEKFFIYLAEIWNQTQTPQYEFIKRSGFDPQSSVILEWTTSNVNSITTSRATINIAQQLGLQYLYRVNEASNDGLNIYNGYWNSYNYVKNAVDNGQLTLDYYPFGNGVPQPSYGYYPDIIAMWQSFAQHLAHTIADRVFGWGEYNFALQGKTWSSSGGVSSSIKYLEGFDPTIGIPNDYFNWIPVGLIRDLMDSQTDPFPVIDNVSGFTYPEIQSAFYLQPDVMVSFKNVLKNIKPSQATAIDQLFGSYGY